MVWCYFVPAADGCIGYLAGDRSDRSHSIDVYQNSYASAEFREYKKETERQIVGMRMMMETTAQHHIEQINQLNDFYGLILCGLLVIIMTFMTAFISLVFQPPVNFCYE